MEGRTPGAGVVTSADPDSAVGWSTPLPSRISSFVGREADLEALASLIERDRLVTISGPGGSGKTRLAIEVARRPAVGRVPYAFVDLAPVEEARLIPAAIAAALGIQLPDVDDPVEALVDAGHGRPARLILDNLEHLPTAGRTVAGLLTRWSNLDVIATSRAPLHIQGEQLYGLGPMAVPGDEDVSSLDRLAQVDSVRLFVERAGSMDSSFALSNENARAIAGICIRLDGLPLAIELAAARTRARSPEMLLAQLEPLLPLLSDGPLDVPLRQQTVQATIEWSVNLLTRPEQEFFACVGVFVGGLAVGASSVGSWVGSAGGRGVGYAVVAPGDTCTGKPFNGVKRGSMMRQPEPVLGSGTRYST